MIQKFEQLLVYKPKAQHTPLQAAKKVGIDEARKEKENDEKEGAKREPKGAADDSKGSMPKKKARKA